MRIVQRSVVLLACTLAAAVPALTKDRVQGYLAPGEFDVTSVLEPAPRPGDPRYDTDRRIFRDTRKLKDTPRWQLATADVATAPTALLHDFSCAVGIDLTVQNAPKLAALVQRAGADTGAQTGHAKDVYARQRPFLIDHGAICQPEAELFDKPGNHMSYDYPSGHTTWGWTWALVLTAVAPDRAQQILRRGRAYGDSRFVCGAHNESAVEGGMQSASATMALVSTKPAYQTDLAAARSEMASLGASATTPPTGCDAEAALIAQRVMPALRDGAGPRRK